MNRSKLYYFLVIAAKEKKSVTKEKGNRNEMKVIGGN